MLDEAYCVWEVVADCLCRLRVPIFPSGPPWRNPTVLTRRAERLAGKDSLHYRWKPQVDGLSLAVWPWAALLASLCLHVPLEESSESHVPSPCCWLWGALWQGYQHSSPGVGRVGGEWLPRATP